MNKNDLYSIGQVSAISNVPIKTLRYYDSIGLLPACKKNEKTGYRYYTKDKILQLFFIRNLQNLGFSLKEIERIKKNGGKDQLLEAGRRKLAELQQTITRLESKYIFGNIFLERIQNGQSIMNTHLFEESDSTSIKIESIPDMNVIYQRHILNNYVNHEVNIDVWGKLLQMAKDYNVTPVGPITAIYHNPPLEQFFTDICDYELYLPIMESIEGKFIKQIKSYTALTTIYVGRYQELINPYLEMMRWIKRNKFEINGDISEAFLISPMDTGNENDYITKIIIPIKKKK